MFICYAYHRNTITWHRDFVNFNPIQFVAEHNWTMIVAMPDDQLKCNSAHRVYNTVKTFSRNKNKTKKWFNSFAFTFDVVVLFRLLNWINSFSFLSEHNFLNCYFSPDADYYSTALLFHHYCWYDDVSHASHRMSMNEFEFTRCGGDAALLISSLSTPFSSLLIYIGIAMPSDVQCLQLHDIRLGLTLTCLIILWLSTSCDLLQLRISVHCLPRCSLHTAHDHLRLVPSSRRIDTFYKPKLNNRLTVFWKEIILRVALQRSIYARASCLPFAVRCSSQTACVFHFFIFYVSFFHSCYTRVKSCVWFNGYG